MIYFAQRADGAIKIGTSENVPKRLATLSKEHGPLAFLGEIPGDRPVELHLHDILAPHRLSGEWFAPHPDVIARVGVPLPKMHVVAIYVAVSEQVHAAISELAKKANRTRGRYAALILAEHVAKAEKASK